MRKWVALSILAGVLIVQAIALWPELSITRVDLNDNVFHYGLAQGFVESIEAHQNPLNHWFPQWGFGYRVFRTYQPLPAAMISSFYFAAGKHIPLMTVFCWVRYLSLVLLPASFFCCALASGLGLSGAAAAAILSPLISTNGLYGIEYGSFVWFGSGLFTQQIAVHFLLLTIGCVSRWWWRSAGALLGLTFLSHFLYGGMAAVTILVMLAWHLRLGRRRRAWLTYCGRVALIGSVAAALSSFSLWMLLMDRHLVNHSIWEPQWKWMSFGAHRVIGWLLTGELLDHGRLPVLSLLALAGIASSFVTKKLGPVVLAGFWLVAYFGWPWFSFLPQHRFIGPLQIFLVLLAARGLAEIWDYANPNMLPIAIALTGLLLLPAISERSKYLEMNAQYGEANLAAFERDSPALDAALAIAKQRGGRAYAGLPGTWGGRFPVGSTPVYAFLSRAEIPAVSMLYHSMSKPSDGMYYFNDQWLENYHLCNVRTVIAPANGTWIPPGFLVPLVGVGPFMVLSVQ